MPNNDFADRYGPYALVTGASSGIGWSFAKALAAKGLNLVLVARRAERLEDLAAQMKSAHGVETKICTADLTDGASAQSILDQTAALDIGLVVSNAGFGAKGDFASSDRSEMLDMVMVNCTTPMVLAHGFIPRLRQRGKGGIIFTSSVEGLIGCPYSAAYSATKALVIALGEALWGELFAESIDVLTLCPGATATEAAAKQGIDPSTLQNVMSPDDVAALTLENIKNGPTYIPSAHYRATFEHILALPRRDALTMMAKAMKR